MDEIVEQQQEMLGTWSVVSEQVERGWNHIWHADSCIVGMAELGVYMVMERMFRHFLT